MKPLQWVAVGYLVIALYDRLHGYDLLADPLGWVLVGVGVSRLPPALRTDGVRGLAWLAGLVSLPLWVPAVSHALDRTDPSLPWAASLPELAFGAVLCRTLARAAQDAGQRGARELLRLAVTASVVVAVLPVLVFGAGWSSWGPPADAAGQLLHLGLVVLMLALSGRAWARRDDEADQSLPEHRNTP